MPQDGPHGGKWLDLDECEDIYLRGDEIVDEEVDGSGLDGKR